MFGIALGALGAGFLALWWWPWLRDARYRYDHEGGVRPLRPTWIIPTAVIAGGAIGGARASDARFATVAVLAVAPLLALAAIDLDVRRLPDRITAPLGAALLLGVLIAGTVAGTPQSWHRAVIAGVVLGVAFAVLAIIGGGLGLGDAKLAPSLGLLLGYLSWPPVMVAIVLAFITGSLHAVWLMAFRGAGRRSTFAFGPHLIAGTLITLAVPALATF